MYWLRGALSVMLHKFEYVCWLFRIVVGSAGPVLVNRPILMDCEITAFSLQDNSLPSWRGSADWVWTVLWVWVLVSWVVSSAAHERRRVNGRSLRLA